MLTANKFSFLSFKDSLSGKQDYLTLKIEPNENLMTRLMLTYFCPALRSEIHRRRLNILGNFPVEVFYGTCLFLK